MSFKKSTSLILAFFLLVSNLGMAFNVHFCSGAISSISLNYKTGEACVMPKKADPIKKCCAEKAKENKKCCSDKKVEIKKKSEEVVIKTFSFNEALPFVINDWNPIIFQNEPVAVKQNTIEYCCDANAPPLFKLYSQYIFYA
jgi:hypothetical protein